MRLIVYIFLIVVFSSGSYFSYLKLNEIYLKLKKKNEQIFQMQVSINKLKKRNHSKEFFSNELYDNDGIKKFDIYRIKLPFEDNIDDKKPLGYLEKYKENVFYMRGNGNLFIFENFLPINTKKFEQDIFPIQINTNIKKYNLEDEEKKICFKNYIGNDDDSYINRTVRDIMVWQDYLYVVLINFEIKENQCFASTIILKGKINLTENKILFSKFFSTDSHIDISNENFDPLHAGGVLIVKSNQIILAYPDFGIYKNSQIETNPFGKIINISEGNKYDIISIGHRNPQGLYYDIESEEIISTEHGPTGGDEINLIKKNKNYGWPIASYYSREASTELTKSRRHDVLGFEEPLWVMKSRAEWDFNIGPSRIIKFRDNYLVLSMSWSWLSGHGILEFERKNNKLDLINKFHLFSRVRDIIKIKEEYLIAVLESNNELIIMKSI